MKSKNNIRKPETLEDIVFEGRNKSYGAFDLNQSSRKYLFIAFLISFIGVTTAVAVPFLKSFQKGSTFLLIDRDNDFELTDFKIEPPKPPKILPPVIAEQDLIKNIRPIVVEKADSFDLTTMVDLLGKGDINQPVDPIVPTIKTVDPIPVPADDPEPPTTCPEEEAMFQGGNVLNFRKWVSENIRYPEEAIHEGIFGKVIVQFCVNKKGEVVDIKLLRTIDPAIDNETIRVISSSPRWNPAKQGGNPVKQLFVIPFQFEMR